MFHVVTRANRPAFASQLKEMHQWRARIFVDEQGWDLPVVDGLEIDEYDDDEAIYFLDFDDDGGIVSGQRMRPTADKSLTGDHFPSSIMVDDVAFFDAHVWEMSRGFVLPAYRGKIRNARRSEMRLAILETAHAAGVERFIAFTDTRLLPYFLNSAYRFRMLGLPVPTPACEGIAIEIEVSAGAIMHMRERLNMHDLAFLSSAPGGRERVEARKFGRGLLAA